MVRIPVIPLFLAGRDAFHCLAGFLVKTDNTGCRNGGLSKGETARTKLAQKEFERGTKQTKKGDGSIEKKGLIKWLTPSTVMMNVMRKTMQLATNSEHRIYNMQKA